MSGICLSDGVYSDGFWHRLDGDPDFPSIIRKGNLRHIRLLGAAQAGEAMTRAAGTVPPVQVHWRHMLHPTPATAYRKPDGSYDGKRTDDGMWLLPPGEWRENLYFSRHKELWTSYDKVRMHVSTNNEFSTGNLAELQHYIEWECQRVTDAAIFGMRLDALSFPTHYPRYHGTTDSPVRHWLDEGHFDLLFNTIATHQGPADNPRIWCLPNAYVHPGNLDGLMNIRAIWRRFKKATGIAPHMALGEYGYAKFNGTQFDPHGGHRADPTMSARASIKFLVELAQNYLVDLGIDWMLYTAGLLGGNEVTTFHYTMPELDYYADLVGNMKAPVKLPDTGPLPEEPPPDKEDTTEIPKPYPTRVEFEALEARVKALEDALAKSQAENDALWLAIMKPIGVHINKHTIEVVKRAV